MHHTLLFVDIGTHMGQEYNALFKTSNKKYWQHYMRHLGHTLKKGGDKISLKEFRKMRDNASIIRANRSRIKYIMMDPNPFLFSLPVYREADIAFCAALSENTKQASLMKLFFANHERLGQGSSLFEAKPNINIDDFTTVLNIDSNYFAHMLKDHFDSECGENFSVILRLNNEGAEVGVIKSFATAFGAQLKGVLGSLADVAKVHGQNELNEIHSFMHSTGIPFIPLYSSFTSWPNAIKFISQVIEKNITFES